jgi:NAD(P)-dependent dehydrogenase (short-subunit alcohol dehydrogenase family)
VDIRDSRRIAEIVDDIMDQFGKIDILVNNAAIYYQQPDGSNKRTRFIDSSEETWRLVMDVNLLGTMSVTQAVLRKMVGNGSGKIINIGSVAGVNGIVNMVDYSASKGAIIAFTRALAQEVAEYKININCVSPGSIDVGRGGPQTFLGRMGSPDEVADLVSFLAGSAADFITGQNYIIDGGRTLSMKCE